MNLTDFTEALIPPQCRIFGLRLKPFCIGHALLLHRYKSPFVTKDSEAAPALPDLLFAVLICSRSYEEACVLFQSGRAQKKIRWWLRQLRFLRWFRPLNVDLHTAVFLEYLTKGNTFPGVWHKQSGGRQPGAPWLQILLIELMEIWGMTESQAMNTPVGKAQWNYCAYWERRGAIEIQTAQQRSAIEAAKEEIARMAKEKAEKEQAAPAAAT